MMDLICSMLFFSMTLPRDFPRSKLANILTSAVIALTTPAVVNAKARGMVTHDPRSIRLKCFERNH
jgi:hypothetical protein